MSIEQEQREEMSAVGMAGMLIAAMDAVGMAGMLLTPHSEALGRLVEADKKMHSFMHITDPTMYRDAINSDSLRQQVDLAKAAIAFILAVQAAKNELAEGAA